MLGSDATYPGSPATPAELLKLAEAYRKASQLIITLGHRGDPLSRAPYRLAAIHAVELYLNAFLLHAGHPPPEIRGFQHDLAKRTDLAMRSGLVLRKRTTEHLTAMTSQREYLVSRYGAELASTLSQLNRLAATLEEVAAKVTALVQPQAHVGSAKRTDRLPMEPTRAAAPSST